MNNISLEVSNNVITVNGVINFNNMVLAWQQGTAMIGALENVKINLKGLSQCDSSGLALFVEWVRTAKTQNKKIVFISVPSFVQDISRVYGLEGVLPVSWEN
jgi:anti-anti-sigma factor